MSMTDDAEQKAEELDDKGRTTVLATDLRVGASGRLTIPEGKRERYGIEQGDYVDAVFVVEDKPDEGDV